MKSPENIIMIDCEYIHVIKKDGYTYIINAKSKRYQRVLKRIQKGNVIKKDSFGNIQSIKL